jgi:hypothetical protein
MLKQPHDRHHLSKSPSNWMVAKKKTTLCAILLRFSWFSVGQLRGIAWKEAREKIRRFAQEKTSWR